MIPCITILWSNYKMMHVVILCVAVGSFSLATSNLLSSCPLDLTYVEKLPWNTSVCSTYIQNTASKATTTTIQHCCLSILSLFGIGMAQHLKQTSLFQLPDFRTSSSCLQNFQSKLTSLSLPPNIVSTCFGSPKFFVTSPQKCAGIQTKQDWVDKLGSTTQLDTTCQSDLSDPASCEVCVKGGLKLHARLTALDGNATHSSQCFYFIVLYAAGVVSENSPDSISSATCLFALPMSSISSRTKNEADIELPSISIAVGAVILIFFTGLFRS